MLLLVFIITFITTSQHSIHDYVCQRCCKCYIQFYSILKFKGLKWSNAACALPKGHNPCSLLLLDNIGIVALTAQTLYSSGVSKLDTPSTTVVLVRINDDGHQMHRTLSVGARDKT